MADTIDLLTSPPENWMPVFQPILYTFQRTGPVRASYPTLVVTIEVSDNGTDFSNPIILTKAISQPIDSLDRYTINVAPYLAALFSVGHPVTGTDISLYKLYMVKVGRSDVYDGTGMPEYTTNPAYSAYAVDLPTQVEDVDTVLSIAPTYGYNNDFAGISTRIDLPANTITNTNTSAPDFSILPCTRYPKHIYWLNRFGGWQAWVFDGKHEYEDEVGDGVTWQDENNLTHTASVGPVQHKCSVKSGFVSKSIYDTIASIRYSIKVYHRDGSQWREVNIERGNYPKYKEGDKRREVNFSFTYAEPLIIQQA